MSNQRSPEYTLIVLNCFIASTEELLSEHERCKQRTVDPDAIYLGDVTFSEWGFLILTELEFRLYTHPDIDEEHSVQIQTILEEAVCQSFGV